MFLAMIKLMRRLGAILKFSFENEVCDESGALGCWFQGPSSPLSYLSAVRGGSRQL